MRTPEVSKKVVVQSRNANTVDCDNNVVSRGTYVKVRDRTSPMYGKMGEIRALFKNTLFLWMKSPALTHSNGIFSATTTQVINAGAQHLKDANKTAGLSLGGEGQANPDRQQRDSMLRNQLVIITKGALKGLKGNVTFANETHAEVHIHSRNQKLMLERQHIQEIRGGSMMIRAAESLPMALSFDEAAQRDYVNVEQQAPGLADQLESPTVEGLKTPIRELDEQEANEVMQ